VDRGERVVQWDIVDTGFSGFFVGHWGHKYASSVLMQPITAGFVEDIDRFVQARGLDLVPGALPQGDARTTSPPATWPK
jgi:hypothetical protein